MSTSTYPKSVSPESGVVRRLVVIHPDELYKQMLEEDTELTPEEQEELDNDPVYQRIISAPPPTQEELDYMDEMIAFSRRGFHGNH